MKVLIICFFLINSLFAQNDFMKMCLNPTPSQKATLEAVSKEVLMEFGKSACKRIEERYIHYKPNMKYFENLRLSNKNLTNISAFVNLTNLKQSNLNGSYLYIGANK